MKRIITALLLAAMLIVGLPACTDTTENSTSENITSEEPKPTPNPESDFEYEVSSLDNKSYAMITKYTGETQDIVIPETLGGATPLLSYELFADSEIETVVLPDSMPFVTGSAFKNCSKLKYVSFGEGITEIKVGSFAGCTSLEEVTLPTKLNKIEADAFYGCTSLKAVTFPGNKMHFGMHVFLGCSSLSEVVFKEGFSIMSEGYAMFWYTNLKSIKFPSSVATIYAYTFTNSVDTVTFLGDAPELIGTKIFDDDTVIYYDPSTSGWDTSVLKDMYELVPIQ